MKEDCSLSQSELPDDQKTLAKFFLKPASVHLMHQLTVLSPETPSRREDLLFDSTSLFFERTHKLLQKIKNKQPARSFGVAQASGTQQSPRYQPRCQPVFQGPQHSYYQDLLSRPTSRLSRIFLLTKAWFRPTTGKQCRPQNLPAD